ncbi:putative baseplate assembly protein [Neptunomonas japonica]|uniref:putative baseplate assembly protein n=1 Tax=Neptunomonas japonica TaxID=417574 RepID=UPI00041D5C5F|nr:putative baseplate assembly protein [Neptunomonas japonica]
MIYTCCEENRRAAVEAHATLNGIDWLEVLDLDAPAGSPRQQTLMLRLLKPVPPGLSVENIRIEGGERIRHITVEWVAIASEPPALPDISLAEQAFFTALPDADHLLLIRTGSSGDFSGYQLTLVKSSVNDEPLNGFDPRLSAINFTFKVECPSDFDCADKSDCSENLTNAPDINYLARDFSSIRRLVIDRLSRQMPGWRDRSPADMASTMAELIAYVGDFQHYHLDAISTEAYLHTARRRTSIRRHALLVDYHMHEGCNARTWLHFHVDEGSAFALPADIRFYTHVPSVPVRMLSGSPEERTALQANPAVFEPMHSLTLRSEHNEFEFYTWGDASCCLPVGAVQATLRGHWPDLEVGSVLIFREMMGAQSGVVEDANPQNRHAVRLRYVNAFKEGAPLTDPLDDSPITEINWYKDDAMPFPLCLSAQSDEAHGGALLENVSLAFGNNVLVDHGVSISDNPTEPVPASRLYYPPEKQSGCNDQPPQPLPVRFQPHLASGPVTYQGHSLKNYSELGVGHSEWVLFDSEASAHSVFEWRTQDALPVATLIDTTSSWHARRDLLSSDAIDTHFVLESEDGGTAQIRFGDDVHGRRPDSGTVFTAHYRIGNGPQGNVGAGSIVHLVSSEGRITSVTNFLPARGGRAPESRQEVKRHAPYAFRTQERAVTPADYSEVVERLGGVQRASSRLRWTGSWHTVFTTVDRNKGFSVKEGSFDTTVVEHLDRYRMAGHDVHVNDPVHVSLEIDILVCVNVNYFRSNVRQVLLDVLSSSVRSDGTLGLFHPDNFSFGQTVYLSTIYAAARSVAGVDSVQVTRFQRQSQQDLKPLADGYMDLGPLEIARLDNNPNFPEHGVLRLELHGGK